MTLMEDFFRDAVSNAERELGHVEVDGEVLVTSARIDPQRPPHLRFKCRSDVEMYRGFPTVKPRQSRSRRVEAQFVAETKAELRQVYANKWLAIEGQKVLAASSKLEDVVAAARATGIRSPFVYFVEEPPSTLGV